AAAPKPRDRERPADDSMALSQLLDTTPPSLLATAACSCLRPGPDCRPRRDLLHLSYSCAPSYSDGARDTRPIADIKVVIADCGRRILKAAADNVRDKRASRCRRTRKAIAFLVIRAASRTCRSPC